MSERNPPVWMQSGTYQASDDRMITGMLVDKTVTKAGVLTTIEGGVVGPLDQMRVTAPGFSMTYNISDGTVVVPAMGATPPGAYLCYNEGVFTGTLDIESGSNPRIDLIVAEVRDQASGDDVSNWRYLVIKGSPGPNPNTPTWTGNQVPIAAIRVIPAAQNGGANKITDTQITDLRNFITGAGGVHVKWQSTPNPAHSPGRLMYDATAGSLYVNDGTKWDMLYTYDEWLSYFAAYRPVTASNATQIKITARDVWSAGPRAVSAPSNVIAPIQRTNVMTPSGSVKITVSAYGRVDEANTAARVSAEILSGTTVVWKPSVARGISFYSVSWGSSSATFLAEGLPKNTPLTIRLSYQRTDNDNGNAFFMNSYLMVDPVI